MTRSVPLLTSSGTAQRSAPLEPEFRAFLARAVADRPLHARFLNTLSMMEHIGSRKIMSSQARGPLNEGLLQHMAEETRHAFFFKRQARRMAGGAVEGYTEANTLARGPAAMYFSRLDAEVSRRVTAACPDLAAPYLAVSLAVELRACWVYPLYHAALEAAGVPLSLKSIIAEEDAHLDDMHAQLSAMPGGGGIGLEELGEIESGLFTRLLPQLVGAIEMSAALAS
jgi:hypothetical protein